MCVLKFDFAFSGELETFGEILSRPDDRNTYGFARQNSFKDVQVENSRRQTNK